MAVSLSSALESLSAHRDVVPLYFVRSKNVLIVTGVLGTHGGAVILDDALQFVRSCPSKSAALSALRN
jgi:hypothetical protein